MGGMLLDNDDRNRSYPSAGRVQYSGAGLRATGHQIIPYLQPLLILSKFVLRASFQFQIYHLLIALKVCSTKFNQIK